MRKLTVNLPDIVVSEVSGMDESQMVALGQAISMYSWLGELLHCVGLEAQRQRWLDQQYDLGEPKSDVRKKWDALDRKRCDTYDREHRVDGRGNSIAMGSGLNDEDETLSGLNPAYKSMTPAEQEEVRKEMART